MNANKRARTEEQGIALLVALLSLMVLTFLGLTLAATTTTELQIATNYRRSQQALYNAEAGVEMGKIVLQGVVGSWSSVLPQARAGVVWTWDGTAPTAPAAPPSLTPSTRDWENQLCDQRGGRVGYGVVLSDGAPIQYRTDALGASIGGAFTVWVRRETLLLPDGTFQDNTDDTVLVLTAEGLAPYTGVNAATTMSGGAAVRTLEVALIRSNTSTSFCAGYSGQTGAGHSGAGFAMCSTISGGSQALAAFDNACRGATTTASAGFGSGAAGGLADTGVN